MTTANSKLMFLHLLSILIVCFSELQEQAAKPFQFHSSRRELIIKTIQHQVFDPTTPFPGTTVTNPTQPDPSSPPIVAVPSAYPSTGNPINTPDQVTNPANTPVPVTNPVTTPSTNIPGSQPVSNPATTFPNPVGSVPVTTPVVAPPSTTTNAPGQSWCVAKGGVPDASLQAALDYACGNGADCSGIQQGAGCYNPSTLQNHASYAFNSYFQKNPVQTSCDFGGAAALTSVNPSSGSCIFTTSSASSTMPSPTTMNPTPTPNTASTSGATPIGSGAPPTVFNPTNPASGGTTNPAAGGGTINPAFGGGGIGFADSPQSISASMSSRLQPFMGCFIAVASLITWRIVLEI